MATAFYKKCSYSKVVKRMGENVKVHGVKIRFGKVKWRWQFVDFFFWGASPRIAL